MLDNGSQQVAILFGLLVGKSPDRIRLVCHDSSLVTARPAAGKWGISFNFMITQEPVVYKRSFCTGYISMRKQAINFHPHTNLWRALNPPAIKAY